MRNKLILASVVFVIVFGLLLMFSNTIVKNIQDLANVPTKKFIVGNATVTNNSKSLLLTMMKSDYKDSLKVFGVLPLPSFIMRSSEKGEDALYYFKDKSDNIQFQHISKEMMSVSLKFIEEKNKAIERGDSKTILNNGKKLIFNDINSARFGDALKIFYNLDSNTYGISAWNGIELITYFSKEHFYIHIPKLKLSISGTNLHLLNEVDIEDAGKN